MKTLVAAFSCVLSAAVFSEPSPDFIRTHAVELKADLELAESEIRHLAIYKIVSIGEVHGNDLSPQIVAKLVERLSMLGPVVLGLEIKRENQNGLTEFLKTGDEIRLKSLPHFNRSYEDGRSSLAMAELIQSLRKKNIEILAYDPDVVANGQDRDTKMAVNILAAISRHPEKRFVIFGGNLHMATAKGNFINPGYLPALYQVFSLPHSPVHRGDIFSIKIRYGEGSTSWVCPRSSADCGVNPIGRESVYSQAVPFQNYFLREGQQTDDGYWGSIFLRSASASVPWKSIP